MNLARRWRLNVFQPVVRSQSSIPEQANASLPHASLCKGRPQYTAPVTTAPVTTQANTTTTTTRALTHDEKHALKEQREHRKKAMKEEIEKEKDALDEAKDKIDDDND